MNVGRSSAVWAGSAALLLGGIWAIAGLGSTRPWHVALALAATQGALTCLAGLILATAVDEAPTGRSPRVIHMLCLHTLLYYGIANLSPALFPDRRPLLVQLFPTVPGGTPGTAYVWATLAAILLLIGATAGASRRSDLREVPPAPPGERGGEHPDWLPGYATSLAVAAVLVLVLVLGTARFGLEWGAILEAETPPAFGFVDQLLLYGALPWIPVIPLLAASAYVTARDGRRRRWALVALGMAAAIVMAGMAIWRMRSTAMAALILPLALLAYLGRMRWRSILVPSAALAVVAYAVVTVVRLGDIPSLVARGGGTSAIDRVDVVDAVRASSSDSGVLESAAVDASYRAAGLEPVAAILYAQDKGEISPGYGRTVAAGFLQALPAATRPDLANSPPIKFAPARRRVFQPGDWVLTVLAELVYDFGPVLLVVPAVVVGFLLRAIDDLLLGLGSRDGMEGFRVIRLAWLVAIVFFEFSLADRTLLFFKATMGYSVLIVATGAAVAAWKATRVPEMGA